MLSYPSGMTVSSRALTTLTDALRGHRSQRATRWRKLRGAWCRDRDQHGWTGRIVARLERAAHDTDVVS